MKRIYPFALTLFFVATILSCQTESNQDSPAPQAETSSISSIYEGNNPAYVASGEEDDSNARTADANSTQESLVLKYVNQARSKSCKCGSKTYKAVGAVTLSGRLNNAANKHAVSMAKYDYFSHTGRNGSSPGDRITTEGYIWRTYGENIAAGYDTVKETVDAWMKSEGHCKNIMNGSYKHLGVGYGYKADSKFKYYWVIDLASKD